MILGIPKEIKTQEGRVGMVPAGVHSVVQAGHKAIVERSAGLGAGISDAQFEEAGAQIVDTAAEVFSAADMIVKVKEPQPVEYEMIREGQTVFTYFHFAASRELTDGMVGTGAYCFAYETLDVPGEGLPLLTPMSEVAGRMAIQEGAYHLERPRGGCGQLLGGVPGTLPGKVPDPRVVGWSAPKPLGWPRGLGARVYVLDISLDRLRGTLLPAPAERHLAPLESPMRSSSSFETATSLSVPFS